MLTPVHASTRTIKQKDHWRLKESFLTSARIFECDAGIKALALGPDSDFSRVRVAYYDSTLDELVEEAAIGPGSPLIAGISAVLPEAHQVSGTDGRLLVWTDERFRVGSFFPQPVAVSDLIVPPVLDVIGYFGNPPAIAGRRSDRLVRSPFPLKAEWDGSSGLNRIIIPWYGRKFASILFKPIGLSGLSSDPTYTVKGYTIGADGSSGGSTIRADIGAGGTIDRSNLTPITVKASDDGLHDVLVVEVQVAASGDVFNGEGSEKLFTVIKTSDEE